MLSNGDLSRSLDVKDWHNIWLSFTVYALIITIGFAVMFKHKHNIAEEKAIEELVH
ncbi:hypothetical protein D3C85_1860570 [compost metagenome]